MEVCKDIVIPTAPATPTGPSNAALGGSTNDNASFFRNVSLDQLGGLGADQLRKFDPAAAAGFSPTQLAALAPDALKGASPDLIKNLTPSAVAGMLPAQVAALAPDAVKGFTTEQIKNLPPEAIGSLKPTQVSQLAPTQLAAIQPDQFRNLNNAAVGSVTPSQFNALPTTVVGSLDSTKLSALDNSVIKSLDKDSLAKLNPAEVKKMDGKELSEMIVNLNAATVTPADIKGLLPTGWLVDDKTGKVQPPAGTALTLPQTAPTAAAGVELPRVPDLNKGLSVGGDNTSGSVIDGMKKALDTAGLPGFNMSQDKGVLNVTGTGSNAGTKLAFIPDGREITQAPTGTAPGVKTDAAGKYVVVTPDGMQVPIIPALSSPENVQRVSPGAKVEVDAEGSTKITEAGKPPVVGIPDPLLRTSSKAPGLYREGSGANEQMTVVYPDGTAQIMRPAVQDPAEFREATKAFPQIREVIVGADGIIKIDYNGQILKLSPTFDVVPGSGSAGSTTPSITAVSATTFRFTNSKGDVQEINLRPN